MLHTQNQLICAYEPKAIDEEDPSRLHPAVNKMWSTKPKSPLAERSCIMGGLVCSLSERHNLASMVATGASFIFTNQNNLLLLFFFPHHL